LLFAAIPSCGLVGHQKRYHKFIGIGIASAHNIHNSILYVVGTCDSDPGQVVVPLLVPQVCRATTTNFELAMGRKGIGRAETLA
jgi:hypothetical protein